MHFGYQLFFRKVAIKNFLGQDNFFLKITNLARVLPCANWDQIDISHHSPLSSTSSLKCGSKTQLISAQLEYSPVHKLFQANSFERQKFSVFSWQVLHRHSFFFFFFNGMPTWHCVPFGILPTANYSALIRQCRYSADVPLKIRNKRDR